MTHENTGPSHDATGRRTANDARTPLRTAATSPWSRLQQWILVLGFVLFPAPLFALIALSFQSVAGSVSITGAGTPTGTLSFGTVSAFEPLSAGVSRTVAASNYTISTNFGVRVTRILSLSSNYTLRARLQSAQPLAWQVDGVSMTTSAATVATSQSYGTTLPHTLAFVVPFTYAAGAVTTVFEVTAIAN